MSNPDRTGGAGPVGGASAGSGTSGPPVPESAAGAVDARVAAPAAPDLTAGALNPESVAPAVSHGWAAALTGEKAHWVPEGAPQGEHNRRPTGLTLEGYDAFIDERGLAEGAELPPCRTCCRELARMSAPSEPTQP